MGKFNRREQCAITANAGAKGVNSFVKIFTGGGGKGGSGQIAANVEITVNTTGFIDGIIIGNSFGLYANTPAIANVYTDTHFKQNTAVLTGSHKCCVFNYSWWSCR